MLSMTEYIKDIETDEIPGLDEILKMRQDAKTELQELDSGGRHKRMMVTDAGAFMFAVEHLFPCVVGKSKWKTEVLDTPISKIMTTSDEAFVYLLVENGLEHWKNKASRNDVSRSRGQYTGKGCNRPGGGWPPDAIQRYNELMKAVDRDRRSELGEAVENRVTQILSEKCLDKRTEDQLRRKRRRSAQQGDTELREEQYIEPDVVWTDDDSDEFEDGGTRVRL